MPDVGWLGAHGARTSAEPATSGEWDRCPDYPALVEVLLNLHQLPDWAGETTLTSTEAAKIRACGLTARAGRPWRCPLLPREYAGRYPALRHLCDDIDPAMRPVVWHPKRAPVIPPVAPIEPLSKIDRRFLALVHKAPERRIRKYVLQRKLWRFQARFFNHTLSRLIAAGWLALQGRWLYTAQPAAVRDDRAVVRPRRRVSNRQAPPRPILIYTTP